MKWYREKVTADRYILADYYLESQDSLHDAAWAIAVGQSVGNPYVRSEWESRGLMEKHAALIVGDEKQVL